MAWWAWWQEADDGITSALADDRADSEGSDTSAKGKGGDEHRDDGDTPTEAWTLEKACTLRMFKEDFRASEEDTQAAQLLDAERKRLSAQRNRRHAGRRNRRKDRERKRAMQKGSGSDRSPALAGTHLRPWDSS